MSNFQPQLFIELDELIRSWRRDVQEFISVPHLADIALTRKCDADRLRDIVRRNFPSDDRGAE